MSYTVRDWIEFQATTRPDKLAMVDLASGRQFTYADTHERIARVAGYLKSLGINPGDRIAFLALNTTDVMELIFACWRIGAIALALNFRLIPSELAFILDNAGASAILVDQPFEHVAKDTKKLTMIKHWILTDGTGRDSEYEQAIASAEPVYEMYEQTYEDQCLLMYSSGTTGPPKGVIITHGMIEFSCSSAVREDGVSPKNVALNNMPLFHIGGLNVTALPTMWVGGTCVVQRIFDPEGALKAINDADLNINALFMVPAAYNALRAHPLVEKTDFSRITSALCGAETVTTELMQWWYDRGVIIQEGYGMTETAAFGCVLAKGDIPTKIGSAGKPLIHSTIKIVDPGGTTCAPNVSGEIWFKGAVVTPGYWKNPEANAETFVDGWLRSGDIGCMDEDGFITIEDRIKDMYISGGENVYPAEIENLLSQMPQIAEVAVVGLPDKTWGETGCVFAVLKPDQSLNLDEVLEHLRGKLAKFKLPSYLHIMNALPRGGTGKVLKFELRKSVPKAPGSGDG